MALRATALLAILAVAFAEVNEVFVWLQEDEVLVERRISMTHIRLHQMKTFHYFFLHVDIS